MKIVSFEIPDVYTIESEVFHDERGSFRRSYCHKELKDLGIELDVKQGNISENFKQHTLRGFHYQIEPTKESKMFSCITGSIFNVVLDLRKNSRTYLQYVTMEISSDDKKSIYVPAGCANAFLTLSENTIVHYYMGDFFNPDTYNGIRYNDPRFSIPWPFEPKVISKKDLNIPDFVL